ncbi:MAG: N-acyl homoserine lactonase family protein [Gammaproteobacteria bacterium]|nr:N-acyl homoserine lactonase family protein [Gammaproteobacteria bacterium]MBU1440243.1 N-acyl homoserine lactonase family protein [Gammaproteobacteria bacterium]MBU2288520.1 N-acyl homoserine lactonase family protein [Gammaproteobacteria bacterium]
MSAAVETYRVYAIKYAHHERLSSANFIGGDSHDVPMPLDYFVWAVVGESRTYLVDTGFDQEGAAKRGRIITRPIDQGLKELGIDPETVDDVIVTHMHYDHAGNRTMFPRARFHLQDREMAYCTGRCMCHAALNHPFEVADVASMVHRVFDGRVRFHDGDSHIAPGLSVHRVGGHTDGLQVVRVHTRQGWLVLASDASHLYANMEQERPFPAVYNIGDMLEGFHRVYGLADAPRLVVPGHDPDVLRRFPALSREHEGWIVQLDGDMR